MSKRKVFVLKEVLEDGYNAGSKARIDIDEILARYGFPYISNYSGYAKRLPGVKNYLKYRLQCKWNRLKTIYHMYKLDRRWNDKDLLFIQFPDYSPAIVHKYLYKWVKNKKTIVLIHDIDEWRYTNQNKIVDSILNDAEYLVVHNERMKQRLQVEGIIKPKIVSLDVFDYLMKKEVKDSVYFKSVIFAGNLTKSQFLKSWIALERNYRIDLYGNGLVDDINNENKVKYHGSYTADDLLEHLSYGFGLVWDGDSVETCSGKIGEYTRWNNPHKFSLYMAAGIPVFVWKESAISDIVIKNKLGYAVGSLKEIDEILLTITEKEYYELCENVKSIQKKVGIGGYFTVALDRILEQEQIM
ncbi:hypothetical protein [Veillonella criceti]|uniref:Beta-1,6-galactofuranosyltransferase n=1 Tax=Veillonella criceti TaxID=103891 RepID=A0A380NFK3_9FIRM|nr:hypothetical protein [Veillonella criceti]SUP39455.1 beta-1,6-galactofuranosyltransferase [Veillonella criceti]